MAAILLIGMMFGGRLNGYFMAMAFSVKKTAISFRCLGFSAADDFLELGVGAPDGYAGVDGFWLI